nr:MAG: putative polyprotein [Picornavirales sp.]
MNQIPPQKAEKPKLEKWNSNEGGQTLVGESPQIVEPKLEKSTEHGVNVSVDECPKMVLIPEPDSDLFMDESESDSEIVERDEEFEQACLLGKVRWIVSDRFCKHTKLSKCPCMTSMRVPGNKAKYHFDENSLNDLAALCQELALRSFSFRAGVFDALKFYENHFVVKIACTTKDRNLSCDAKMDRSAFLGFVWEIRKAYLPSLEGFGQMEDVFEAQDNPGFIEGLINSFKSVFSETAKTVSETVSMVFNKVVGWLKDLVFVISETASKLLSKFFNFLMSKFVSSIDALDFLKKGFNNAKINACVILVTFLIVIVVVDLLAILAFRVSTNLIDKLFFMFREKTELEAQGPQTQAHPIVAVVTMLGIILGLTTCEFSTVAKRCREFTSVVVAGLSGTVLLGSLFILLPVALQTALSVKYASEEQKQSLIIEDWLVKSSAVLRLQKVPRVLASKEYYEWCVELIGKVSELRSMIRNPVIIQSFMRNVTGLMSLVSTLEAFRDSNSARDYPFAIHLAGPPGFGKSLITSRLLRDLFEVEPHEIFARPLQAEHWDAFVPGVKVVTYDEFLIGSKEKVERAAAEILELVSTKRFVPPCASLDNPVVGIKGTECAPEGVLTINNTAYANVPNFNSDAINRRRKAVVSISINSEFRKFYKDSEMQLNELSNKQIADIAWVDFKLLPRVKSRDTTSTHPMNYQQMLECLKQQLRVHKETCDRIAEHLQQGSLQQESPQELFDQMMAEMRGMKDETASPMEEIFNIFTDVKDSFFGLFAQGPCDPNANINLGDSNELNDAQEAGASNVESLTQEQSVAAEGSGDPKTEQPIEQDQNSESNDMPQAEILQSQKMDEMEKFFGMKKRTKPGTAARKCYNVVRILKDKTKTYEKKVSALSDATELIQDIEASDFVDPKDFERDFESIFHYMDSWRKCYIGTNSSESSIGDYQSCDDDEGFKQSTSKVFAKFDHSNVEPTEVHVHCCLGHGLQLMMKEESYEKWYDKEHCEIMVREVPALDYQGNPIYKTVVCDKNFAHKHEKEKTHPLLCSQCRKKGWTENKALYYNFPVQNIKIAGMKTIVDSLPSDEDYDIEMYSPEKAKEVREKINELVLDKYLRCFKIPVIWVDSNDIQGLPEEYGSFYTEASPKDVALSMLYSTAKGVAVFVMMYSAIKTLRSFFNKGKIEDNLDSQSAPPARETRSKAHARNFTRGRAQAGCNITFAFENGIVHNAIPIKDNIFLTYYHALPAGDGDRKMVVYWNNLAYNSTFSWSAVCALPDDDIAFVTVTNPKMPSFPNRVKKFWTDEELMVFKSTTGYIESSERKFVNISKKMNVTYSNGDNKITLQEALLYLHDTKKGDCGLEITSSNLFPGKTLGMHVAGGRYGSSCSGVATIITRDLIEQALKPPDIGEFNFEGESQSPEMDWNVEMPNLEKVVEVPLYDQIYIPKRSSLKHSVIQTFYKTEPQKCLPVLSANDRRAKGLDPMLEMVTETLQVTYPEVDDALVDEVASSLFTSLQSKLDWVVGRRRLTFEEALAGIPGKLASMKVKSLPGYPLCKVTSKPGKTEFFSFTPNGELVYQESFKELVYEYLDSFLEGKMDDRRFVAYLKDELISKEKSAAGRSRIIYSGDLISNVAYRMCFGDILAAFNNSYHSISSAIGINQYSHDMQMVFDYLTDVGTKFVAGDFKNFDKHMHPLFQKKAYEILMDLAGDKIPLKAKECFVKQQCFSGAQVYDFMVYYKCTHFSGCFFTTIVNNLVNELYLRYIFARVYPTEIFEKHVRAKILGDDHIYCFSDECSLSPFVIRDEMDSLGLTYTSDKKNEDLLDEFRTFEQITFLGAHPILIKGQYCGALKKSTLEETILWTRNNNATITDEVNTVIELSSIWGEDYYEKTQKHLTTALEESGLAFEKSWPSCKEMQRIVASRTCTSEHGYPYGLFAQGPPVNSLAKLNEGKVTSAGVQGLSQPRFLMAKAVNEGPMDVGFGVESNVFRQQVIWSSGSPAGGAIFTVDVPFGLLPLGNPDNVQNMPFDRFTYWTGDVELSFQINGTPFQQGILAAYFIPLETYTTQLANITAAEHVLIQPDQSATYTLKIPFRYFRSMLNTITRGTPQQESLGRVHLAVLSPLTTVEPTECVISVYSRFPNSLFTIPRPLDSLPSFDTITTLGVVVEEVPELDDEGLDPPYEFEAQGNTSSTQITNTYTVGGDMPNVDVTNSGSSTATQDISPEVSIPMPLDNPPLSSGAIPVEQAFPGLASSHGIRPTRDLQLKPSSLSRQQTAIFGPDETKFSNILGKRCLLTTLDVNALQPSGTRLLELRLDSLMGLAVGTGIPLNIVALNQFFFWRADIQLTFVSVQTRFHSVRLNSLVAYAAPGLAAGARTVSYTDNMNFASDDNGTNYTHEVNIPYNAQTEFLRTYEGPNVVDPIQNYSVGTLGVYILNQLRAPETVAQSIQILVFLRFTNPKVAVPRAIPLFSYARRTQSGIVTDGFAVQRTLGGTVTGSSVISGTASADAISMVGVTWRRNKVISTTGAAMVGTIPPNTIVPVLPNPNITINRLWVEWRNGAGDLIRADGLTPLGLSLSGTALFFYVKEECQYPQGYNITNSIIVVSRGGTSDFIRWSPGFLAPINFDEFVGEAQGPGDTDQVEEVNPANTAEDLQNAQSATLTKSETNVRPNIVCKSEIGEKFEFCPSDVTEVCRRYVKRNPVEADLFEMQSRQTASVNGGTFRQCTVLNVRPLSMWSALFAAWAGGVKFRIYLAQGSSAAEVAFQPFYNPVGQGLGIPMMDTLRGGGFRTYNDNGYYSMASAVAGPLATEVLYPVSELGYIDVSVPFQSHFNFCFTQVNELSSVLPVDSGSISISRVVDINDTVSDMNVYTAFADDLRLGIFRPPELSYYSGAGSWPDGLAGFRYA